MIGAVVLVAGIIVVAAFIASAAKPPAPLSSHGANSDAGGAPAGEDVGVPNPGAPVGALTSDGSSVQFTWTNPSPKHGDTYAWAPIVDGTPGTTATTSAPTTTVPYAGVADLHHGVDRP
ncbi:MAG: hypothetical protein WDM88_01800 [Galbitalea sp.]